VRLIVPHISQRSLRSLRLRANLTQEDLAKILDVEKSLISHYERGRRKIPVVMRWALFSILGSFDPEDNTYVPARPLEATYEESLAKASSLDSWHLYLRSLGFRI
jgi:transcriptional regulator with XRE-family HTH domain